MKLFHIFIFSLLFVVNFISASFAQDVTLSWDASPTSGVTGYKVYYKQGDMNYPFNGTGADEGPSPVDIGDVLSTTLTNLPDGKTYFFTVTAYVDNNQESSFSNIVSNSWLPALLAPANNATGEPVPVTFQWETAPVGYDVSYTLFYGTDRNEVVNAKVAVPLIPPKKFPNETAALIISVLFLLAIFTILAKQIKRYRPQAVALTITLGLIGILTACGGGGSSDGGQSTADSKTVAPEATLFAIDKGSSDYHQAYDIKGSTTYYWKVVATDTQDPNLTYESEVLQFTTEDF